MTPAEALATALLREDMDSPGLALGADHWWADHERVAERMAIRTLSMLPEGWALVGVEGVAERLHDARGELALHAMADGACSSCRYRAERLLWGLTA